MRKAELENAFATAEAALIAAQRDAEKSKKTITTQATEISVLHERIAGLHEKNKTEQAYSDDLLRSSTAQVNVLNVELEERGRTAQTAVIEARRELKRSDDLSNQLEELKGHYVALELELAKAVLAEKELKVRIFYTQRDNLTG